MRRGAKVRSAARRGRKKAAKGLGVAGGLYAGYRAARRGRKLYRAGKAARGIAGMFGHKPASALGGFGRLRSKWKAAKAIGKFARAAK